MCSANMDGQCPEGVHHGPGNALIEVEVGPRSVQRQPAAAGAQSKRQALPATGANNQRDVPLPVASVEHHLRVEHLAVDQAGVVGGWVECEHELEGEKELIKNIYLIPFFNISLSIFNFAIV
jgi:hypothetical protein